MNNNQGSFGCALSCTGVAFAGGLFAAALLWVLGGYTFLQGAFIGILVFAFSTALLIRFLCKALPPLSQVGETQTRAAETETAAVAAPDPSHAPEPAAEASASAEEPAMEIKPSTSLKGEEELAERKGEWKYEGETAAAPAASEGPGTKPATLTEAREGGPDDLKQIKGVGPKLEGLLHSMGFYHFDQVASWGADEVSWVDQNLEGFKGRVSRDNWVEQAKTLATGGETEFSKKVEKGGVYD